MQILAWTIFWAIGILWAMYYWYWDTSRKPAAVITTSSNPSKVVFGFNSDKRRSASSMESLEFSDNEGTTRKNMQKLKHEIKTRWPSKVDSSINARSYKSF